VTRTKEPGAQKRPATRLPGETPAAATRREAAEAADNRESKLIEQDLAKHGGVDKDETEQFEWIK
jgi:hypothetical protein